MNSTEYKKQILEFLRVAWPDEKPPSSINFALGEKSFSMKIDPADLLEYRKATDTKPVSKKKPVYRAKKHSFTEKDKVWLKKMRITVPESDEN